MSEQFRCEYVSWNRMHALCRRLAADIRQSAFTPDIIVAVARGGFVPARILCDFLDVTNLASIRIVHYGAGGTEKGAARLIAPINTDIKGLRVLLVDDLIDTGKTLAVGLEHIKGCGPAEVKSASLLYKETGAIKPDFFVRRITNWRWILFPWAAKEDVSAFLRKLEPMPRNVKQAALALNKTYGLKLPQPLLADVFGLVHTGRNKEK